MQWGVASLGMAALHLSLTNRINGMLEAFSNGDSNSPSETVSSFISGIYQRVENPEPIFKTPEVVTSLWCMALFRSSTNF
jgi:hypothetical protein